MNAHQRRIKRRRKQTIRFQLGGRWVGIYSPKSEAFRDALARVERIRRNACAAP